MTRLMKNSVVMAALTAAMAIQPAQAEPKTVIYRAWPVVSNTITTDAVPGLSEALGATVAPLGGFNYTPSTFTIKISLDDIAFGDTGIPIAFRQDNEPGASDDFNSTVCSRPGGRTVEFPTKNLVFVFIRGLDTVNCPHGGLASAGTATIDSI